MIHTSTSRINLFVVALLTILAIPCAEAGVPDPCPKSNSGMTLVVAANGGTDYKKIQQALDAARPGDTVLVKAGKYPGGLKFNKSGSAGACIRLEGEPGAVISGGSTGITIAGKKFIAISGLTVSNISGGNTPTGIKVSGASSHISLTKNVVKQVTSSSNAHAISFYGTASQPLNNLFIDSNEVMQNRLGQSEALVLNGNVELFQISNNKVHDNDNIGIDIIGYEGNGPRGKDFARKGFILNNQVWNNSSGKNSTYGGERSAGGIYVDGGRGIEISGNKVTNCDIGIELASEHAGTSTSGIIVKNNDLSNSYQGNLMMGGYDRGRGRADNISIEGNKLANGRDGELIIQHNTNGISIKGNSFRAKGGGYNIYVRGSNNNNPLVEGNTYASKGPSNDRARKDGSFTMLNERDPATARPVRNSRAR